MKAYFEIRLNENAPHVKQTVLKTTITFLTT